jgi:hypothetical protein
LGGRQNGMSHLTSFAFVLLAATSSPRNSALTVATASHLIREKGASAALQQIYEDDRQWPELLHGIATGRTSWLNVANELRSASDAGATAQLELAVGEALEHRPANVLRVALPTFGMSVCGGPDVDDPRFDSYELSIRAIEKRKRMLAQVQIPTLRLVRDQCIQELESSKSGIAQFYGRRK